MTGALIVKAPGLFTTVQDRGRFGYRNIGVPVSGALDQTALRLANALVGNDAGAAALEMLALGPTLEVADADVRIALVGDAPDAAIVDVDGTRRPAPAGQSHHLLPGEVLHIGKLDRTFCACVAIEGGIDVPLVLGSRSTYVRGGFGGFGGRPLRKGDRISAAGAADARGEKRLTMTVDDDGRIPIRVVLGPQADTFTDGGIAAFLGGDYRVTNNADRMGFRLEGPMIAHRVSADIVSDGAVAGSIQVPGSQQPIVLLADGQSVGGYTKIATVVSCDLGRLARTKPGRSLRFTAVSHAQAEALAQAHEGRLQDCVRSMTDVIGGLDIEALYNANLVSGVTGTR